MMVFESRPIVINTTRSLPGAKGDKGDKGDTGLTGPPIAPSLTTQTVTGTTTLAAVHEGIIDVTASAAATVTLTGDPGTQTAIAWSGVTSTVEGVTVTSGRTYTAVRLASGWRLFEVTAAATDATPVPVLPVDPLWNDTAATVTIPTVMVGVEYRDGTGVLPPGFVLPGTPGAETVITAVAAPGYVLPGIYEWRHFFPDPAKITLVASDAFTGTASPTVVGRTLPNNAGGGTKTLVYRHGYGTVTTPTWTPPALNWTGGGFTGTGLNGAGGLAYTPVGIIDPTVTGSGSGGTLAAGTYSYMVTAVMAVGETGCINEKQVTLTGSTSSVGLSWPAVTGASSVRVWRGTSSGTETLLTTLAGSATSFTDDGSLTPGTAAPPYLMDTQNPLVFTLATSWQQVSFDVVNWASGGSLGAAFSRIQGSVGSGYTISLQNGGSDILIQPGSDTPNPPLSANQVTWVYAGTKVGTWKLYAIGTTLACLTPDGTLYTTTAHTYGFAMTDPAWRDTATNLDVTIGAQAGNQIDNLKIYEVGR